MRNRLVITLCAVVSLLAGAGLLTFWLVRSLAPAAALNYTPWPLSPEPYTQADLDEALALRTEGYEAQSVAAFDRALADWTNEAAFHAREERIRRLLCSYEEVAKGVVRIRYHHKCPRIGLFDFQFHTLLILQAIILIIS